MHECWHIISGSKWHIKASGSGSFQGVARQLRVWIVWHTQKKGRIMHQRPHDEKADKTTRPTSLEGGLP